MHKSKRLLSHKNQGRGKPAFQDQDGQWGMVSGMRATACSVPATLLSVPCMDLLAIMAPAVTLPKKVQRETLPTDHYTPFSLTPDNSLTKRSFTSLLLRPNPTQSLGGRTKEIVVTARGSDAFQGT